MRARSFFLSTALLAALACDRATPLTSVDATAADGTVLRRDGGAMDTPKADSFAGYEPVNTDRLDAGPDFDITLPNLEPHPIVLVHGFLASADMLGFGRVQEHLRTRGATVSLVNSPAIASVSERADALALAIDALLARSGHSKVQIIAHSMGGLDARYAISTLGYGDRVSQLDTVGTPHRGTPLADAFLDLSGGGRGVIVEAIARIYGRAIDDVDQDPELDAALTALQPKELERFNAIQLDDPRVSYRSWAGISDSLGTVRASDDALCDNLRHYPSGDGDRLDLLLVPLGLMSGSARGLRNDGLVPVLSAKWGDFAGCLPADHADQVGSFDDMPPSARTGFDFFAFYRQLAGLP